MAVIYHDIDDYYLDRLKRLPLDNSHLLKPVFIGVSNEYIDGATRVTSEFKIYKFEDESLTGKPLLYGWVLITEEIGVPTKTSILPFEVRQDALKESHMFDTWW